MNDTDSGPDTDSSTDIGTDTDTDTDTDTENDGGTEDGGDGIVESYLEWHEIPVTVPEWDLDYTVPEKIWVVADDDVYFQFDDMGPTFIGHYDGSEVVLLNDVSNGYISGQQSLFVLDAEHVWRYGDDDMDSPQATVEKWDGSSWESEVIDPADSDYCYSEIVYGTDLENLTLLMRCVNSEGDPERHARKYAEGKWVESSAVVPTTQQILFISDVLPGDPVIFSGKEGIFSAGDEVVNLEFPGVYDESPFVGKPFAIVGNGGFPFWVRVREYLGGNYEYMDYLWRYDEDGWTEEVQMHSEGLDPPWNVGVVHPDGRLFLGGGIGGFGDNWGSWQIYGWDGETLTSLLDRSTGGGVGAIGLSDERIWVGAKKSYKECVLMWAEIP